MSVSIQIQHSLCILSVYRSDTTRSRTQCTTVKLLVCINPDTTLYVFLVCIVQIQLALELNVRQ